MDRRHADSVAALKQVHLEELQAVRCTTQLRSLDCSIMLFVMSHSVVVTADITVQLIPLPPSLDILTLPRPLLCPVRGRARDGVALDQLAGQIKQTSGSIKILEVSWD
jgi:hypothetical protein